MPDFKKLSKYQGPEHSPGFLLWHISTAWRTFIEAVLKSLNITHPQFVILAATGWLTQNNTCSTQAAIGKMAGLDPNTTSQILKGLEAKSLIKRSPSGRANDVSLTAKGSQILQQALPAVERADTQFFRSLAQEEASELIRIFHKLIAEQKGIVAKESDVQ